MRLMPKCSEQSRKLKLFGLLLLENRLKLMKNVKS